MASTERSDNTEGSDDLKLLARLRARDPEAFDDLVRDQTPRLLAVARRILRCEHDAQDAVQDAFVAAFRSLDAFNQGSRLSTWLYRIAVNAALMKLRARSRRREDPLEFDDGGPVTPAGVAEPYRSDELLERGETRALVRACIDRLPENYRAVIVLRDLEGFDTAEAAPALGMSTDALKMRLHRARQALRKLLEPHLSDGESRAGTVAA